MNKNKHELVAIKRKWVPEWLFAMFAWPIDFIVHQPFRWIFTRPLEKFWRPWPETCPNCGGPTEVFTKSQKEDCAFDGESARCVKCNHAGWMEVYGPEEAWIAWEEELLQ